MIDQKLKQIVITMLVLSAFTLPSATGHAGESCLSDIIVSARGTQSLISSTPGGTGTVQAEDILEAQAPSLSDIAALIPGVSLSSDSAWGSDINIRGLSRDSVVLLIDGCRVNTSTDINARFGLIDPMDIERIEVLKGPISALYGSGSIGGVVNVITRKGCFTSTPAWSGTVSGGLGSNPSGYSSYANAAYESPDIWVYASGSRRDYGSYDTGDSEEMPNSQFDDRQGRASMGKKWNSGAVTEFSVRTYEAEDVGIPGTGTAPLPTTARVTYPRSTETEITASHTISPDGPLLKQSAVKAFYQKIDRRVQIDELPAAFPKERLCPSADHETMGIKWQNTLKTGPHQMITGLDVWNWHMESERETEFKSGAIGIDRPTPTADQLSAGGFAEDDWHLSDTWTVNLGARIDYISMENDAADTWILPPAPTTPNPELWPARTWDDITWNAHAGLTWHVASEWSLTGICASSYRAPTILERFKYLNLAGGIVSRGNPDLDPERSLFFEFGLHYDASRVHFHSGLFANRLQDLIIDQKITPALYESANVNEAEIYGAEAEVSWNFIDGWLIEANIAYTTGRDTTENDDLPFIPPLKGMLSVRFDPMKSWWFKLGTDWALKQDNVPDDEDTTDGWITFNARVGFRFNAFYADNELILGAENITNAAYRNYLSTSRGIDLKEAGTNLIAVWQMKF
ncbi:MAG: TonB-dependent receptor [Desulfobacterales bacterium]|nr:TonB-dependent receptor [Desulfobacterales bacterium]MDD4072624.1 TonB-dependent receptor [Desulfobacterales bacterium]MDD4393993.1 TonB-dependent receptor [Desulfobacterales bacterium]